MCSLLYNLPRRALLTDHVEIKGYTDCIIKKWYSQEKNILDIFFFQNVCVFGIIVKAD